MIVHKFYVQTWVYKWPSWPLCCVIVFIASSMSMLLMLTKNLLVHFGKCIIWQGCKTEENNAIKSLQFSTFTANTTHICFVVCFKNYILFCLCTFFYFCFSIWYLIKGYLKMWTLFDYLYICTLKNKQVTLKTNRVICQFLP